MPKAQHANEGSSLSSRRQSQLLGRAAQRSLFKDQTRCFTKASVRRVAKRGGCKKLGKECYPELEDAGMKFLDHVLSRSLAILFQKNKRMLTKDIVCMALAGMDRPLLS